MSQVVEEITGLLKKVEPNLPHETEWPHRKYLKIVNHGGGGYSDPYQTQENCNRLDADLVSSEMHDDQKSMFQRAKKLHAPAIDIDIPCRLVPSGTDGHFHLYIDKPMDWKTYENLLKALVAAGIVEEGFLKMAQRNQATHLRTPDKPKGPKSRVPSTSRY